MIPNISPNGQSFRGAGNYHLFDKPTDSTPRPRTSSRLLFTETRNLANTDPQRALTEMWRTAQDAPVIKANPGGRPSQGPVKTISLAWKPGQAPSRAEMTSAADDFLHSMGWSGHQALYASHSDTAHPHIHIILNRVHPLTGKTLNDWQDRKRAQKWALGHEQSTGPVLCTARLNKHAPRSSLPHPAAQQLNERPELRTEIRAKLRQHWAKYHLQRRGMIIDQQLTARRSTRVSASLAREGDFPAAFKAIAANDDRHRAGQQQLAQQRQQIIQLRRRIITAALAKPSPIDQRAARKALAAQQAAGYAALRSPLGERAGELARAEINIAFAHRWAEIERLPAEQRDAARAALLSEQQAAMGTRMAHHAQRLGQQRNNAFKQLSQHYRMQRRALMGNQRATWQQAAAGTTPSGPRPPQRDIERDLSIVHRQPKR